MRDIFIKSLTTLAEKDKDIVFLTGDLGFGSFDDFESRFPNQYFNVGISEQNMIGLATGLSLSGKRVIVYSIGNFVSLRCLEQIRNDACYHNANITIVSNGGGFSYGALGMSHHTTEDLAILRSLPSMTVVAPSTEWEVFESTAALIKSDGVGYLRLDKSIASEIIEPINFTLGKSRRYLEGSDITIISTGGIIEEVITASHLLKKHDISVRIVGMHTIKPIDKDEIILAAKETGGIITVEEHNKIGGLGGAVSEVCMDNNVYPKVFCKIGLDDIFSSIVGTQNYLREKYSMDSQAIVKKVIGLIARA
jgi:transketolase